MVDRILTQETGPVTHSVFADQEAEEDQGDDSEGNSLVRPKNNDILNTFKHVYVPEVVRNQRMWFKRVPRLGSFMAVPLVY